MSADETYRDLLEQEELELFGQQEGDDYEWNVVQKKKHEKSKEKPTVESPRTTLTVPCRFFRIGKCAAGTACRFSHDNGASTSPNGNPSPSPATSPAAPIAVTSSPSAPPAASSAVACRYHLSGYCRTGARCPFMHASRKSLAAASSPAPTLAPKPVAAPKSNGVIVANNSSGGPISTSNHSTNNHSTNYGTASAATNNTVNMNNTYSANGISAHAGTNFSNNGIAYSAPNSVGVHGSNNISFNSNTHNIPTINFNHNNGNNNANSQGSNNISFGSNVHNVPNSAHGSNNVSFHVNGHNISTTSFNNNNGNNHPQSNNIAISQNMQSNANNFTNGVNSYGFPIASPPAPRVQPSLLSSLFASDKDSLPSVMSLWPSSPPKFVASSLPSVSPFTPIAPRSLSSSLPSAGLPNLSSSPSYMSSLSSSPFALFPPFKEEEEEEDDDDDDDLLPQQPIGLTIIDDSPDDLTFNPFEELTIGNTNSPLPSNHNNVTVNVVAQSNSNSNSNSVTAAPQTSPQQDLQKPKSYADIAKANIPKHEEQPQPTTTIIFEEKDFDTTEEVNTRLCQFYLQGICRYGPTCRNVHGDVCESCQKPCLLPDNPQQNEDHIAGCVVRAKMLQERDRSRDVECGICYEKTVDKGRRFGLLSHCEHPFCLECIREWRGGSGAPTSTLRSCPICRVTSYFIIPSEGFIVNNDRKVQIVDQYKSKLSTITCKYFNKGKGTCKFGTSCMYSHTNPDGSVYVPPPSRKMQDAEGDVLFYNGIKLSMFMEDWP